MSFKLSASVYRARGWLCVRNPIDVEETFRTRSHKGEEIILKAHHYQSSIFPTGAGKHFKGITRQREHLGLFHSRIDVN